MHIQIVTPSLSGGGNGATADRWKGFLIEAGYPVSVSTHALEGPMDLLIALHAWRSAPAIQEARRRRPELPIVVILTGTDLYKFLSTDPETTEPSLEAADVLVGLHHKVGEALPERFRSKLQIIYQSAPLGLSRRAWSDEAFDVCVVGHLREEKDPLRAAWAARRLPAESGIRVTHLGKAHTEAWAELARQEMEENPRYRWHGEVEPDDVARTFARSRAMVISSLMEGGANVVSEAVRADLPILASAIPGNQGLLDDDYPGYFPPQDTEALAGRLRQLETDPELWGRLREHGRQRADRFTPDREAEAVRQLVKRYA